MVPFLSGWGHWVVGIGGGGRQGPPNQKIGLTSNAFFLAPPAGCCTKTYCTDAHTHTFTDTHSHTHTHTFIHTHSYTHTHNTHTRTDAHRYAHRYTRTQSRTHTRTHTHTHTHNTHTHTHTHVHTQIILTGRAYCGRAGSRAGSFDGRPWGL